MVLAILRGLFLVLAAAVTALYALTFQVEGRVDLGVVVALSVVALGLATAVIAGDVLSPRKKLSALSGVLLGLAGGLVVAFALGKVVDYVGLIMPRPANVDPKAIDSLLEGVKVFIGLITCYLGISLVLQTKDDFRFVLPYVEFAKQVRGTRPTLLDTNVIIDGRVLEVLQTRVMQGSLIVPRFVLAELQSLADSTDKVRRARGRRGLDILQKLQANGVVEVVIDETEVEGATVDQKLVALAQQLQARVMTHDVNLAKIADVRGVEVININDLARAMRPVALPGEELRVKVVKPGESYGQGVGYLEDGTMVVVEDGRQHMGQELDITVTSTLQTSAGRMIFGRRVGTGGETATSGAATANRASGSGERGGAGGRQCTSS